mmetsp:Transcript_65934/g.130779  ORF Transcript_65934/g.130779 Transcript_65934/m.130779 type:complete len:84 (-) Transcript_65934:500-751(-)
MRRGDANCMTSEGTAAAAVWPPPLRRECCVNYGGAAAGGASQNICLEYKDCVDPTSLALLLSEGVDDCVGERTSDVSIRRDSV